jgi:hypothetical protein
VPAEKALIIGAYVDARFNGVDKSEIMSVPAVDKKLTPRPAVAQSEARCETY